MILYYGSYSHFEKIDLSKGRKSLLNKVRHYEVK